MAREMQIIEIEERANRLFSREELIDRDGNSLVLPETRALPAVELKDVHGGINLRTLGLIGYLPLTREIVLNLRPKFPLKNLWRMLAIADENYDRVLPVLRAYERSSDTAPHQLLARGFCHYLKLILDMGIARGYYREPYTGFYKPRVAIGQTLSRHLSRGDHLTITGDVFTFSANLAVNGLLKSGCLAFLRRLARDSKWDEERKLLLEALNALQRVAPARMRVGDEALSEDAPKWLRDYYHGALSIYSLLLGHSHVGFGYEAQGNKMPSFLFSLDAIFESYIRNTFRTGLESAKIAVLDGNNPNHSGKLFVDTTQYSTKPDLIFRKKKTIVGLGEVKYKPEIKEGDRYQVISHVLAANCKTGVWISPASAGQPSRLDFVGTISTGAKFYHYQLDISGDLDVESNSMVEEITALLPI